MAKKSVLWILIKIKFLEMIRGGGKTKGKKGKIIGGTILGILYVISFLFIGLSIGALFWLIGTTVAKGEYRWLYFAYMAIFTFLLFTSSINLETSFLSVKFFPLIPSSI